MSELTGSAQISPAANTNSRHTEAKTTVGVRRGVAGGADNPGEYMYVKAGVALGAVAVSGEPVSLAGGLDDVRVGDLDTGAFVGIAEAAFASGEYGWIRTRGKTLAIVESGAVAGDYLQLSATAGKLKKITTSGQGIAIAQEASDNASAEHIDVFVI